MSLPTVYGLSDIQQIIAEAYGSAAGTPAAIGAGSQFGPSFNAVALAMLLLQNENIYIDTIARLGSIPDPLPNGEPNPDVDTFVNAFGFYRLGSQPSQVYVQFSLQQNAGPSGVLIPVGTIVSPVGGPTFSVIPGGIGYNVNANGYYINSGHTSASALCECSVGGVSGNVLPGTITLVIVGPGSQPSPFTVTNPDAPFIQGAATEVGTQLKNRFALYISGGGSGTPNAILAATYGVQAGLAVSYGDQVMGVKSMGNWTFTPDTPAWFSLVVAFAGSGADPGDGGALSDEIKAAILNAVRPAGISFAVAYPALIPVNGAGQVYVAPGYNSAAVLAAVATAFTTFVNNINLAEYGGPTVCSIMQTYVALSQVPGVLYIDTLQLNGAQVDLVAPFGSMFSAGTTSFVGA